MSAALSNLVKVVTLLIYIHDAPSSNFDRNIDYPLVCGIPVNGTFLFSVIDFY
jgi:hypothetical protein